jgi:hypothetical protein
LTVFWKSRWGSGAHGEFGVPTARTVALVACAASILLLAATQAVAQNKLERIEWFAETGGSFLRLGQQPGVFQVPMFDRQGDYLGSYQGTVADSDQFSGALSLLTGLRYQLTKRDSIELSYSQSEKNHLGVEPVQGGAAPQEYYFDRLPLLTINYVRYFGSVSGWKPFVVGGAGVVWQTSRFWSSFDNVDPSFDFGFGADHRLTDRLAFRAEVRDYVERLPSPLHGYSHDIAPTAGLVISSRPTGPGTDALSPIEIFLEGGGSFITGGTIHTQAPVLGQLNRVNAVAQNSFSKAGRFAAGFRIYLSSRGALQFEYSQAPNRFQSQLSTTGPPMLTIVTTQETQFIKDLTVDYVRYLTGRRAVEPFIAAGGGLALFPGFHTYDLDRFSLHFAVGVDIPLAKQLALRFDMNDFLSPQPWAPPFPPINSWTNNLAPMVGLALRFR